MSNNGTSGKLSFTFTELLYGVLIGAALQNVKGLLPIQENVLLLVAVILVADDYFHYHRDVKTINNSGKAEIKIFFLDMLVLAAWYSLALAAQYKLPKVDLLFATIDAAPITLYLIWVTFYYGAVSIWDCVFPVSSGSWFFDNHVFVTLLALICTVASILWPTPDWIYLAIFGCGYVLWRSVAYIKVWRNLR